MGVIFPGPDGLQQVDILQTIFQQLQNGNLAFGPSKLSTVFQNFNYIFTNLYELFCTKNDQRFYINSASFVHIWPLQVPTAHQD